VWRDLLVAAFVFLVVGWLGELAVRKRLPALATGLRIATGLVGRVAVGAVFVAVATGAARKGGYWWFLTSVFSILALVSFALAGLTVFLLVRDVTESHRREAP
jgi:hypothetical protein